MTPHKPEWMGVAARLRAMAAEIAQLASACNLERESCKCGESHRWRDMAQWTLHEKMNGAGERLSNLAAEIERRSHEFLPKRETAA